MRERDRLNKKLHKSKNLMDWENCRVMRNKVVSMRRRAIQGHFNFVKIRFFFFSYVGSMRAWKYHEMTDERSSSSILRKTISEP